tara:strand:- start:524 stop:1648 length:1125 start_codon:yes stop_codon:yes gene_type:complete
MNMDTGYKRTTCRLCRSHVWTKYIFNPTPIANLFPDTPYTGEKHPLVLCQCGSCGHVQIGWVVDDKVLYGAGYKYSTPQALMPQMMDRALVLRKQYPNAKNVLEIGANNGLFVHAMRYAGFRTYGIDPSSSSEIVIPRPFNKASAEDIVRVSGKMDLILANNVFAHIDDLESVFDAINIILSKDGTLIFEVQYVVPMMEIGAFDMIYHEHRDYHALAPLARFLKLKNMVMTGYDIIPAHGGSIRVTAKRCGLEVKLPKEDLDWRGFAESIDSENAYINSQIKGKIAAFGAPAKAVTFIHHFELQDKIKYCVDDTPGKQGKYIAGTNIPVVSREFMEQDKPERMLLLSWNYEALIRPQFPDIDFLVPFSRIEETA